MTIKEIIDNGKMVSEVDKIEQHSIVTIGFENYGVRDETQLTVHTNLLTKTGRDELDNLFHSLSKEFGVKNNSVIDITVIASASTEYELNN